MDEDNAFASLLEPTNEREGKCSICLQDFSREEVRRITFCSHFYHKGCIEQWFKKEITCPLCRARKDALPEEFSRHAAVGQLGEASSLLDAAYDQLHALTSQLHAVNAQLRAITTGDNRITNEADAVFFTLGETYNRVSATFGELDETYAHLGAVRECLDEAWNIPIAADSQTLENSAQSCSASAHHVA